ncbi:MAG TPA: ribose 5-phosphate isomerase B [Candidatus Binatia bacterium]|nr:ribose 5-phosphate isomerase B [Candidatus Binatia bacterium]
MKSADVKPTPTIAVGSDHGGLELKDCLIAVLRAKGLTVEDCGTRNAESVDYPDFGRAVSLRVSRGEAQRGVLICTSGIGMSITANKFPRVRAALVHDLDGARSSREHNDANILVLSGAKLHKGLAEEILETWLETPFAGGRHQRRLDKIAAIEQELRTELREKRGSSL